MFGFTKTSRSDLVLQPQRYTHKPLLLATALVTSDSSWPGVDDLLNNVAKTVATVQGIVPTGQALDHAVAQVPSLELAPIQLHNNLGDLYTIMNTMHDLSSFLQAFPVLKVLLKPVTESLADTELTIQDLETDTGKVVSYSNTVVASIKVHISYGAVMHAHACSHAVVQCFKHNSQSCVPTEYDRQGGVCLNTGSESTDLNPTAMDK